MNLIGITSTIPIEVIYASGSKVVDLNNSFISDEDSAKLVDLAERRGFPESSCAWIKGIYGAVHRFKVEKLVAVVQGDCSNTHALMETLELEGIEIIPFAFPYDRDKRMLEFEIKKLATHFGVSFEQIKEEKRFLDSIRSKVSEIDRLTWQDGKVSGFENHYFHISCSDMKSDPQSFSKEIDSFLEEVKNRKPLACDVRLGYIGIPPIITGIYQFIESQGGLVVFNELQRQFSMPYLIDDIVKQYLVYTYPYHIRYRLEDIKHEIGAREVQGLIHYVQSFCFRQIEDIVLRKALGVPILTIEGNRPGRIDLRTQMRIEAFIDMLRHRGTGLTRHSQGDNFLRKRLPRWSDGKYLRS